MEIQTITRPLARRAAAPIVLEGHPAIAALPARWRWGLWVSLGLLAVTPFLMTRHSDDPFLAAAISGLWFGAWTSALLILRRAGLVRLPFIAVLVAAGAAGFFLKSL